jgi:tetratricopeptide (TPR) repeat protein
MESTEANPSNPQLIARVGHAFYDWASDLFNSGLQTEAAPVFERAISYYDRALAITPKDPVVLGDRAFALHYSGSDEARAALERFVAEAKGNPDLTAQVELAEELLASN